MLCIWDAAMSATAPSRPSMSSRSSTNIPVSSSDVSPIYSFRNHIAAVKALAWYVLYYYSTYLYSTKYVLAVLIYCVYTYLSCRCPWQHDTLASGGGTADRHIRLWNTTQGACVKGIDTGSQVYIYPIHIGMQLYMLFLLTI